MSHDKMDKGIRSSMLDDFLPDGDKSAHPKPAYPTPRSSGSGRGYQGGFDFDRGDSLSDFAGEDVPDDVVDRSYRRPAQKYQPPTYARNSVFNRHTTHGTPNTSVDGLVADVLNEGKTVNGDLLITTEQAERIATLYVREMGLFNDKVGVCWSTEGLKYFKASIVDLIGELYYGSKKVVVVDSETGEVL